MTIQKCQKYQLNCGDTFVLHHSNRIWFDSPFFPSHSWLDIKKYNIFMRHTLIQYGFTIRICIECACKTFEWGILELPSETDTTKKTEKKFNKTSRKFRIAYSELTTIGKEFSGVLHFRFRFPFSICDQFTFYASFLPLKWACKFHTSNLYICVRFAPLFLFFSNIIVIILCSVPFEMRTHFFWWR